MYQKLLLNLICASFFLPALGQESQMPRLSPPKHGETYVIAHRGAHKDAPENSLPAYQKAIDLGCDFIEIDVRSTNDSELVSIHNADIDR
ncbi:MAG: hypothetical protein KDC53_00485, partial [Saprospiraceae bacterium]|nr:hypothetical protein [Saprospiraceae bacterium]